MFHQTPDIKMKIFCKISEKIHTVDKWLRVVAIKLFCFSSNFRQKNTLNSNLPISFAGYSNVLTEQRVWALQSSFQAKSDVSSTKSSPLPPAGEECASVCSCCQLSARSINNFPSPVRHKNSDPLQFCRLSVD